MSVLLTGAFTSVDAKTVTVTTAKDFQKLIENGVLTGGKDSKLEGGDEVVIKALAKGSYEIPYYDKKNAGSGEYVIVNTPNITITGEGNPEIVGRFVLAAENITVSGLTIVNNGLEGETGDHSLFYNKSAISVLANEATITNNTFVAGDPTIGQCIQGIELIPSKADVTYTITGNTFKGFDDVVDGSGNVIYPSYAVSLDESYKVTAAYLPENLTVSSPREVNFDASTLFTEESKNTFEGCAFNYATIEDPDAVNTAGADVYEYAQVEPLKDKDGKILNAECSK